MAVVEDSNARPDDEERLPERESPDRLEHEPTAPAQAMRRTAKKSRRRTPALSASTHSGPTPKTACASDSTPVRWVMTKKNGFRAAARSNYRSWGRCTDRNSRIGMWISSMRMEEESVRTSICPARPSRSRQMQLNADSTPIGFRAEPLVIGGRSFSLSNRTSSFFGENWSVRYYPYEGLFIVQLYGYQGSAISLPAYTQLRVGIW